MFCSRHYQAKRPYICQLIKYIYSLNYKVAEHVNEEVRAMNSSYKK